MGVQGLLADMADLKSIEVDGALYVTTKANVEKLRREIAEEQKPVKIEPNGNKNARRFPSGPF